jgi:hypothetical protein
VAYVNIPRIIYIGNTSPRLQAHLAPSRDGKEGSGCAFFLCHKAQRCSSLPSLHRVQLFSDDVSGLFHHLELGPAYLGHLQAILDQVPAGPFDHPGRYGGTCCQLGSGYASSRHTGTGNAHTARQRHAGPLAGGAPWPCAGDPWQRVCCAWATSAQGVRSPGLGFRRPQLVQCPGRFLDVPQDVEQVEYVLVAAGLGVIALMTEVRE